MGILKAVTFTTLLLILVSGCGKEPSTPMNLTATALSATEISLGWDASEDEDNDVVTYGVYRDGQLVMYSAEVTVTDSGLQPLTEYCYRVKAYDIGWLSSGESNEACATTLADTDAPDVPQNVVLTVVSSTEISLTWDASTDNVGVTGYNIYRDGSFLASVNTNEASDTGLIPATEYCYAVSAYDEVGNESSASEAVCAVTTSE